MHHEFPPSPRGSKSPDLRGKRVEMRAADHPHAGEVGVVIEHLACGLDHDGDCGYDDLLVQLDSGERTRVYEPEADLAEEVA